MIRFETTSWERQHGGLLLPPRRLHRPPHRRRAGSTYQNSASNSALATTTVSILAFDPGAGSNRGLAVCLQFGNGGANQINPTGITVTYGGVGLVVLPGASTVSDGNWLYAIWYYLASQPSSTPSNIVASWTGNNDAIIGAISANGVHQTLFVGGGISNKGTSTAPQVAVRCPANSLSCASVAGGAARTLSAATQTQRWNLAPTQLVGAGSSGSAIAPYGVMDISHKWTQSVSDIWAAAGFYFYPADASPSVGIDYAGFPKGRIQ
jgi:hypothetical protein